MKHKDYERLLGHRCCRPGCPREKGVWLEWRFVVHHIVPRMIGGLDRGWNYLLLCRNCHREIQYRVPVKTQFEWKAAIEIELFGMVLDERNQASREFFNKIIDWRGNISKLRDRKGYDLQEKKAAQVGLEAREIQIGGCAISVVEKTYQEIDRLAKRRWKKTTVVERRD